ncbi:hypothetical protein BC834DRAFT_972383 [Gloeopeniophorella convolvens]|nr:hypothetical protein BC834DRAFT_972383 [Gloeopeniophorella convolvens]
MSISSHADSVHEQSTTVGRVSAFLDPTLQVRQDLAIAELDLLRSNLLRNFTLQGLFQYDDKEAEVVELMDEAIDDCFAKVQEQEVQLTEVRQMMQLFEDLCEEKLRRRERIRQKADLVAQMAVEIDRGRRLSAQNKIIIAEKKARLAQLEAEISENNHRMAQGLPPLP